MERWREIAQKLLEPNKLQDYWGLEEELRSVDAACRKIEGHKLISVQVIASIIESYFELRHHFEEEHH